MSIFTVTITGVTPNPETYIDVAGATARIGAIYSPAATKWLGLSSDDKGRTLVTATLYIDEQPWDGVATGLAGGTPTTLQFPRTGLQRDGVDVDPTNVPTEVVQAVCELAVLIAAKPAVVSGSDQGSNLKAVWGGGGVGVEYFVPQSAAAGTATVMPAILCRLIGRWIASAGEDGSFGGSGCTVSQFSRARQYGLSGPEN